MTRLKKPLWMGTADDGAGDGSDAGASSSGGTGDQGDKTFTQADMDRVVAERLKREREATRTKYADYDAIKAKAEGAKTLEDRIAEMETRATKAEIDALRSKYAADVPEKLRPLLTGRTDEELKAQAALLAEGESERKKQGNHVPREGETTKPGEDGLRNFARDLFKSGD
jgi:riboflavin synthase